MSARGLLVVALGGNAIQEPDGEDSVSSDFARTAATADRLARLAADGWRLVITHGNGPQVGNHLLRSELAHVHGDLPLLPLEVCVADTQGGMGYMLQQCLSNSLHRLDLPAVVATIVTQILVDQDDPGFAAPTKPVGEVIPAERAEVLREQGWELVEDRRRNGFRRVVASPHPLEIVEAAAIKTMVDEGMLVVAAGGGGIPVVAGPDGDIKGVAAVVDKDLASALLAVDLQADGLLVLTNVDAVALNYDTPSERPIASMTVAEALRYLDEGHFAPGSMGPKVEAVARFVEVTGRPGIVTSLDSAAPALEGGAGTRILP
ncbi:MAG TPA: carbamate kinase [Actinomycetota bacterium]|nr:carbamate kinase [Actinomycetota bacterium]